MSEQRLSVSKRLSELDVLRGLAAMAVVACHYASACVEIGCLSNDFHYGAYGPHLFFIISGFVILLTLQRTKTPTDFIVSRCTRLYPAYWAAVALAFVIFSYFPTAEGTAGLGQTLVNLTMLQTWLRVPDIDVVYWTLGVELKFYALVLGLMAVGLLRHIDAVAGIWLLAILAYWAATGLLGWTVPAVVAVPLNVHYGHLFVAGILFYQLKVQRNSAYRHLLLACCLATQLAIGTIESAVVVAGMFGLFHMFVRNRLRWIVLRPLVWLGSISYALYLLHNPLRHAAFSVLRSHTDSPVLLTATALGLSIGVAAIVTYAIEQPALRWLRKQYGKVRQPETRGTGSLSRERLPTPLSARLLNRA